MLQIYGFQVFHAVFFTLPDWEKMLLLHFCKSNQNHFDSFENRRELGVEHFNPEPSQKVLNMEDSRLCREA